MDRAMAETQMRTCSHN